MGQTMGSPAIGATRFGVKEPGKWIIGGGGGKGEMSEEPSVGMREKGIAAIGARWGGPFCMGLLGTNEKEGWGS